MLPVLVVKYKNPEAFSRCRKSVLDQGERVRLWEHDNSETNIGYTAAVNRLLLEAGDYFISTTHYAVLINQDAQLRPDATKRAIAFMDSHPRCAVAGFKQLDPAEPDVITHGGTTDAYPAGKHIRGRVSNGDCDEPKRFAWVNFAACIVRLEAVRELGLLDEGMFLVGSDSDWCYRAVLGGWEVWYCPDAVCLHATDGVSAKPNEEQAAIIAKDVEYWGKKWCAVMDAATNNRAEER